METEAVCVRYCYVVCGDGLCVVYDFTSVSLFVVYCTYAYCSHTHTHTHTLIQQHHCRNCGYVVVCQLYLVPT